MMDALDSDVSNERSSMAWIAPAVGTAVLVPVAVLLHEAGHLFGYSVFGFPAPTLHYASSGFEGQAEFWAALQAGSLGAAEAIVDIRAAGLNAAFGLLVSYTMIVLALALMARFRSILAACLGLASAVRFPLVLFLAVLGRAEHTDEAHVSQALGVPMVVMFLLAAVALAVVLAGSHQALSSAEKSRLLLAMAVGAVVGTGVWMTVLGPALLP